VTTKSALPSTLVLTVALLAGCGSRAYEKHDGAYVYKITTEAGTKTYSIQDADPATFVVLNTVGYAKDKANAYYTWHKIDEAEAKSFVALSEYFAKDSRNVYCRDKILQGADTHSFVTIDVKHSSELVYASGPPDSWGKDKSDFYACLGPGTYYEPGGTRVPGRRVFACSPETFVFLNDGWQRDHKCVYNAGRQLVGADPVTFKVLNPSYGKDSMSVYYRDGAIRGADAESFTIWSGECKWCAKDKNRCYRLQNAIELPLKFRLPSICG